MRFSYAAESRLALLPRVQIDIYDPLGNPTTLQNPHQTSLVPVKPDSQHFYAPSLRTVTRPLSHTTPLRQPFHSFVIKRGLLMFHFIKVVHKLEKVCAQIARKFKRVYSREDQKYRDTKILIFIWQPKRLLKSNSSGNNQTVYSHNRTFKWLVDYTKKYREWLTK